VLTAHPATLDLFPNCSHTPRINPHTVPIDLGTASHKSLTFQKTSSKGYYERYDPLRGCGSVGPWGWREPRRLCAAGAPSWIDISVGTVPHAMEPERCAG
jgi:hypothetical protein